MGLEEWNLQQKALKQRERQQKDAATAGLNMYHGGEHDIQQHDKALKEFRLEQRQRQASARNFRGAYSKGDGDGDGRPPSLSEEQDSEEKMSNNDKTDMMGEEGQAYAETETYSLEDDLSTKDDDDSDLPKGAVDVDVDVDVDADGLVARRIADRVAADEEKRLKAQEKETRQRDLQGGTRWTTPEKDSKLPKEEEETSKKSSIERRIERRKLAMEEAKCNKDKAAAAAAADQEQAQHQKAETPAIMEEDEEVEEERMVEEAKAQEEAAEDATQKAANCYELIDSAVVVAQEANTPKEDKKRIQAEKLAAYKQLEQEQQQQQQQQEHQSQDNKDESESTEMMIPGRRRRTVLEFSFGLIYPVADLVPDTETCVQAAENILPNTLPKGKELQVTFDLDTRPTVSSVEKDGAFDNKEGSLRYIVKGSYAVFIIMDDKEPKAKATATTAAFFRRSLQTADSFRHIKPEEVVDEINETDGTDQLVVGEGGNQWRRIRAAEAIALEDIVDDEILASTRTRTGESEETGNES